MDDVEAVEVVNVAEVEVEGAGAGGKGLFARRCRLDAEGTGLASATEEAGVSGADALEGVGDVDGAEGGVYGGPDGEWDGEVVGEVDEGHGAVRGELEKLSGERGLAMSVRF